VRRGRCTPLCRSRRTLGAPGRAPPRLPGPLSLLVRCRHESMPDVALPDEIHLGGGRHLGQGDSRVQVRMILPNQHRVTLPVTAVAADRIRDLACLRPLASRPPQFDRFCHVNRMPDPTDTDLSSIHARASTQERMSLVVKRPKARAPKTRTYPACRMALLPNESHEIGWRSRSANPSQ